MPERATNLTHRRRAALAFNGGLLFALGLAAGLVFTFALLGRVEVWPLPLSLDIAMPGSAQGWRQAHVGLLFNAIALLAIAGVGKTLVLRANAQRLLVVCAAITGWFNSAGFVIGAAFDVHGLAFGAGLANTSTYLFFLVAVATAVVQTALILIGAWRGMRTIGLG